MYHTYRQTVTPLSKIRARFRAFFSLRRDVSYSTVAFRQTVAKHARAIGIFVLQNLQIVPNLIFLQNEIETGAQQVCVKSRQARIDSKMLCLPDVKYY